MASTGSHLQLYYLCPRLSNVLWYPSSCFLKYDVLKMFVGFRETFVCGGQFVWFGSHALWSRNKNVEIRKTEDVESKGVRSTAWSVIFGHPSAIRLYTCLVDYSAFNRPISTEAQRRLITETAVSVPWGKEENPRPRVHDEHIIPNFSMPFFIRPMLISGTCSASGRD